MKIAILLSGHPRFNKDFDTFLEKLKGYEQADWFCYFWQHSDPYPTGFDLVSPSWANIDRDWAMEKIRSNLPPGNRLIDFELADPNEVEILNPANIQPHVNVDGLCKMYHGVYHADLFRQAHERRFGEYDLVIKARPDLVLLNDCDLVQIKQQLDQNPNTIVIPSNHIHGYGYRTNDMLGIGLSNTMKGYSNAITQFKAYADAGFHFHPETLLAFHCNINGITFESGNFEVGVRVAGTTTDGVYRSDFGRWV